MEALLILSIGEDTPPTNHYPSTLKPPSPSFSHSSVVQPSCSMFFSSIEAADIHLFSTGIRLVTTGFLRATTGSGAYSTRFEHHTKKQPITPGSLPTAAGFHTTTTNQAKERGSLNGYPVFIG